MTRMRVAALAVSVLAMALLTGCIGQSRGEAATEWLEAQAIVTAVDTSGYFTGLAPEPDIYADLDPEADAAAVRELAGATSDYLVETGALGSVVIHYRVDDLVLTPGTVRSEAQAAADLFAAVRTDARVLSAELSGVESTLVSTRDDLRAVLADYQSATTRLVVRTADSVWSAAGGSCGALSPTVDALFDNPAALALTADACGETVLQVAQSADVVSIALGIAGSDGTGTGVRVASGLWSITTDVLTPTTMPLVSAAVALQPQSLVIDGFGLALGQPTVAATHDAMRAVLGSDKPDSVDPMAFEYGSLRFLAGDRIEVMAYELDIALGRLDLAEALTDLDDRVSVSASFGVIDVHVAGDLDESLARTLLEAIAPPGARDIASVAVRDDFGSAFFVDESTSPTAEGQLGDLMLAIWDSLG